MADTLPRPDGAQLLHDAGLRATRSRLAVLQCVAVNPHSTAEEVLTLVRRQIGAVSVQGVYDALAALSEAGLLRRIEPQRHPARYEARTGDNHHHAVCRDCGTVADVDCVVGHAPCLTAVDDGPLVVVDEAEVVFWGLCGPCSTARTPGDIA